MRLVENMISPYCHLIRSEIDIVPWYRYMMNTRAFYLNFDASSYKWTSANIELFAAAFFSDVVLSTSNIFQIGPDRGAKNVCICGYEL